MGKSENDDDTDVGSRVGLAIVCVQMNCCRDP